MFEDAGPFEEAGRAPILPSFFFGVGGASDASFMGTSSDSGLACTLVLREEVSTSASAARLLPILPSLPSFFGGCWGCGGGSGSSDAEVVLADTPRASSGWASLDLPADGRERRILGDGVLLAVCCSRSDLLSTDGPGVDDAERSGAEVAFVLSLPSFLFFAGEDDKRVGAPVASDGGPSGSGSAGFCRRGGLGCR